MNKNSEESEAELKFFVVATPIGNLGDITFRAIETLKNVDLILCEDTRVTKKLLNRYEIQKKLLSYHQKSKLKKIEEIISRLKKGENMALVTDAGTPGISDPGNKLIEEIRNQLGNEIDIIPIPGASALSTLLQVAGIDVSNFSFFSFPPNKKGRQTFFKKVLDSDIPVVFYESPYRFIKNLKLLQELAQEKSANPEIIVGRELTKMYEEVRTGSIEEVLDYYKNNPEKIKGEFVIICNPR